MLESLTSGNIWSRWRGNVISIPGACANCVFDSELDRKNCTSNYDIGKRDIKSLMDTFDLEDIWRRRNQDKKVYHGKVEVNSHELITDWYPIRLTIKLTKFPQGTTHFQTILLFLEWFVLTKLNGVKVYRRWMYLFWPLMFLDQFSLKKWSELQNDKSIYCDIQTWWDVVKRNIKYMAINVFIYLKRKEKEHCSELEHRLDLLKTSTGDHKVFRDTN